MNSSSLYAPVLVCGILASVAQSGQLTLGTNAPPGNPLSIAPGSTSASLLLHVTNNSNPDFPDDYMSAWQTTLRLVPGPGATGTVAFDVSSEPPDYVFSSVPSFGITDTISTTVNTNDTLLAFDFNFPFSGGAAVPTPRGANLLETKLRVSADASGIFDVLAVEGIGNTLWTDSEIPVFNSRTFLNVPEGHGSVRIGQIDVVAAAPALRAGDADHDLDFDQFDIIQVSKAAKYLTGQSASWGEGDWDGAPGGRPGEPPPGSGFFDQFDLIAALRGAIYLTGPYAAFGSNGSQNDAQAALIYDANSGELSIDVQAPIELTAINVHSRAGIFRGGAAWNLDGHFDIDADDTIFKATFGSSFGSVSFGNVASPGLSAEFVFSDLSAVGALAGGGNLGSIELIYVPEPSTMLLTATAFAGIFISAAGLKRRQCVGLWHLS